MRAFYKESSPSPYRNPEGYVRFMAMNVKCQQANDPDALRPEKNFNGLPAEYPGKLDLLH